MDVAMYICPEVSELSEVKTNLKCTEDGCTSVFLNSSNLEMHLVKTHHKTNSYLNKKQNGAVFHYFCPVEGCKYHLNKKRDVTELRWFSKMKLLKQHYLKVHKEKEFECETCRKKFSTLKERNIHCESECGRKFTCKVCNFTYDNKLSLSTHAKRKNHLINDLIERPAKVARMDDCLQSILRKEPVILPKIMLDSSVNIAAAALSELSRKIVVKGVDKGVQTVSRRRSCGRTVKKNASLQTQCRISAETQTMTVYSSKKTNKRGDKGKCIETQTIEDTDNAVDSEDSIFSNFNSSKNTNFNEIKLPSFWKRNESGTQTVTDTYNSTDDLSLNLLDNFETSKLPNLNSNGYNEQFDRLIQQSTILDDTRLCDIETQTELNESFVDDCPLLSHNETQTIRNSLDDIYSHNYTQTCEGLFDDLVEFVDIETQTGWATIEADLVSAETQTIL